MSESDRQPFPRTMIDASSAILLAKAGLLGACCSLLHLSMTPTVAGEVGVPSRPSADAISRLVGMPNGIELLDDPAGSVPAAVASDLKRLHPGERDTLHHCLIGSARFVIIDDGKAVRVCRRYGIAHINALLCPRLLLFVERLSADCAAAYFARISALGRYSTQVVEWAAACQRQDLAIFLGDVEQ